MNITDVLALVKAGFSHDEIIAMTTPTETTEVAEETEVVAETTIEASEPTVADLLAEIKSLKETVYQKNLHTDNKAPEVKQSAEDILAQILNGTKAE